MRKFALLLSNFFEENFPKIKLNIEYRITFLFKSVKYFE